MEPENLPELPKQRNPATQAAHQRQAFWQIYLPLGIFIALVIVAAILALLSKPLATNKWSNISLIYILSISFVLFLILLAMTIVGVYYMRRLLRGTPFAMFRAQRFTFLVEWRSRDIADRAADPFIRTRSFWASSKAFFSRGRTKRES